MGNGGSLSSRGGDLASCTGKIAILIKNLCQFPLIFDMCHEKIDPFRVQNRVIFELSG